MIPESSSIGQPRVSRETRRLLAAAAIAFLVLSVLARLRFPDQPATQNPVTPVLTQLVPRRTLGDLAGELAALRRRVEPFIVQVDQGRTALQAMPDSVATWLPEARRQPPPSGILALDPPTGLTLIPHAARGVTFEPSAWSPDDPSQPVFVVAADASRGELTLQPVYLATLTPIESAVWAGIIWRAPPDTALAPGTFLFSTDAELAGLAIVHNGDTAIVPATTLMNAVRRLRATPGRAPGWLGIEVQSVTPDVAKAVGTDSGLVVAWVDPRSPAAESIRSGDLIETLNGNLASKEQWDALAGRLGRDETLTVSLLRGEERSDLRITAAAPPVASAAAPAPATLGLTLRRVATGAEIVAVDPGSAAAAAALQPGDVIHLAGSITSPTPAQVRTAYQGAGSDRPLLIAITRGDGRHVLTLER